MLAWSRAAPPAALQAGMTVQSALVPFFGARRLQCTDGGNIRGIPCDAAPFETPARLGHTVGFYSVSGAAPITNNIGKGWSRSRHPLVNQLLHLLLVHPVPA